jgi:hypothetical protein
MTGVWATGALIAAADGRKNHPQGGIGNQGHHQHQAN